MEIDEIRNAVRVAVASIAPGCDARLISPSQPLREQFELDSLDWINLVDGLHESLGVDIPESDYGRLATLDGIVSYIASRHQDAPADARLEPLPVKLPRQCHLCDGTEVTLRSLRVEDADLERELFAHLSAESRYKRFMIAMRELPQDKLRALTNVDGVRHVAFIATMERQGREAPLGIARYVVSPTGSDCEFAIAVDDAWQGRGLAGILMSALIDAARAAGLARMDGDVLAANHRMLRFVRQLGFHLRHNPDDPQVVRAERAL